jgi:hypothetical protein
MPRFILFIAFIAWCLTGARTYARNCEAFDVEHGRALQTQMGFFDDTGVWIKWIQIVHKDLAKAITPERGKDLLDSYLMDRNKTPFHVHNFLHYEDLVIRLRRSSTIDTQFKEFHRDLLSRLKQKGYTPPNPNAFERDLHRRALDYMTVQAGFAELAGRVGGTVNVNDAGARAFRQMAKRGAHDLARVGKPESIYQPPLD